MTEPESPQSPQSNSAVDSIQLIESLRSLLPLGKGKIDLTAAEDVGRKVNRLAINFPNEQDEAIAFQSFALIGLAIAKGSKEWVAAILNSSVAFFYLKEKYPASSYNQGTTFTKDMINDLPIPDITPNDRERLIAFVDRIVALKQRDAEADVSAPEREIDQLVYALYGLTPKEIQIVEGVTR